MDANGQRFWQLAREDHFPSRQHATWDRECRVLRLASERILPPPASAAAARTAAIEAIERVPRTSDAQRSLARWIDQPDDAGNVGAVVTTSAHLRGEALLLSLRERPSDLAVGRDGVLYVALAAGVLMHDLRGRWPAETVQLQDFSPWRIAVDRDSGAWLLDRTTGAIARLTGRPLPLRPHAPYTHTTFRPCDENPDPPQLRRVAAQVPSQERPIAITSHPEAGVAVLSWVGDGEARVHRLDAASLSFSAPVALVGARYAYSLAWLDRRSAAVRMPARRDAPAFLCDAPGESTALGEIYPLADDRIEASFVHQLDGPPHYPTATGAEPLHRLSIANLARHGEAATFDGARLHLIDSGSQQTVWHRLNAEASIPPGAGFIVWLATTSEPQPPDTAASWCAHRFGTHIARPSQPHEPRAAWEPWPSEVSGATGLGPWPSERERSGLFSVLIQDPHHRVRTLTGRYLWMNVELFGDGRVTPEIAALRAWGSRFSYRDQYLPRIYRESLHGTPALAPGERLQQIASGLAVQLDAGGPPADELAAALSAAGIGVGEAGNVHVEQPGRGWLLVDRNRSWRLRLEASGIGIYRPLATPADFLERYLASFEAMLTPLEDRVAAAHLLTHPTTVPEANLDWLGAWIGVAFDPALPAECRRAWLAAAPELARAHGTRHGLALALDIATGGGVRGGEIVLLEDFRLRRLLATLLGVDLADERDPLLPGLTISGNSIVGDTLTLGAAETAELLALFREEVADAPENAAVLAFYERLAHRATVLVHQTVTPQDLGLIRRVIEMESPAHVEVRVLTATWPLLVGIASLVGVDTYLGPPQQPRPARLDVSGIGLGDYVLGPAALDPRARGAAAVLPPPEPPVANAGADFTVAFARSFDLDGSASSAAPGRRIDSYAWRRLP